MKRVLRIKNLLILFLVFITAFLAFNFEDLKYGIGQLQGQIKILSNSIDITDALESREFPDSLKQKLMLVMEIKDFARENLGLKVGNNYTTVFNQEGKDILWIVTACPPFELKAYEWNFALAGSFPYKGFFELEKAFEEEEKLKNQGFDTNVRRVSGWSTLGFFNDPILSNMLYKSEGDLANTIIHELTHATVFIKNEVDLNENLATFIGDYGALKYLELKYNPEHIKTKSYLQELEEERNFSNYVISGSNELDTLYKQMEGMSISEKQTLKRNYIEQWVLNIDSMTYPSYQDFKKRSLEDLPNNTFFMSYLRYNSLQNSFEEEFLGKNNKSFKLYVEELIKRYKRNWYDF